MDSKIELSEKKKILFVVESWVVGDLMRIKCRGDQIDEVLCAGAPDSGAYNVVIQPAKQFCENITIDLTGVE